MKLGANGLQMEVEVHGPSDGVPLVLIMGLGMQLVAWQPGFVNQLVARGFRVVRFDNRDAGLSQGFDHLGSPNLVWAGLKAAFGAPITPPYTLADMAADTVGVMDALGIEAAHVCGASMGGMIAQRLVLAAPSRVNSLTLVMTSSGARGLPGPAPHVRKALLSRPPAHQPDAAVAHLCNTLKLIGSPAYPVDDAALRERVGASVRRAYRPAGTARQLVAVAADSGPQGRAGLLGQIQCPVQIVHGEADPLVPVAAAHDLKQRMPHAGLDVIAGMGHDLPEPLWPRLVANIVTAAGQQRP
jgi:pimeloyl-ACP methyl ester carboxylesterase